MGQIDAAPHLTRYFSHMEQMQKGAMPDNPMELLMNPAKMQEIQKKAEEGKKGLEPIIVASFNHHDTSKDGVLGPTEANEFFQHFIERFAKFQVKTGIFALDKSAAMSKKMMAGLSEAMGQSAKEQAKQIDAQMSEAKKEIAVTSKGRLDNYLSNAASLNQKAFKTLDKNGNGTLERDEVVQALTPDSPQYFDLIVALEIMTQEEVGLAQQMQQMGQQMAAGGGAGGAGAPDCKQM